MAIVNSYKPRKDDIFFAMPSGEKKRLIFGEGDGIKISKSEWNVWNLFVHFVENTKKEKIPQEIL